MTTELITYLIAPALFWAFILVCLAGVGAIERIVLTDEQRRDD